MADLGEGEVSLLTEDNLVVACGVRMVSVFVKPLLEWGGSLWRQLVPR